MPDGRKALLDAATQVFASFGFEAADVRGIAVKAKVSPNLVRVHFGSKIALWEACLDASAIEARPVIDETRRIAADLSRPIGERRRDMTLRLADFYAAHPDVRDFVPRGWAEAPDRAERLQTLLLQPAYESSRAFFAAGIEAGVTRSSHPALFLPCST
ncbi:AcrR family transcriptional regulator [Rhodoblastus sphagnicola]|uniref:TetR/AcrR family transcriptional regulator n=1 Tax=Rhodoblastus sphagnicola TaxID=333368 RepID=UPI000CEBFB82|nr:TetR/AcrR family transcriptional regulator [Rhodoblastus sphagnicola]MBB4200104.1 AcrR family transcriptional regulator [Rhodoblastus sphagnicola]